MYVAAHTAAYFSLSLSLLHHDRAHLHLRLLLIRISISSGLGSAEHRPENQAGNEQYVIAASAEYVADLSPFNKNQSPYI